MLPSSGFPVWCVCIYWSVSPLKCGSIFHNLQDRPTLTGTPSPADGVIPNRAGPGYGII